MHYCIAGGTHPCRAQFPRSYTPHAHTCLADTHPLAPRGCVSCYATHLFRVWRLEGADWSTAPMQYCIAGGTIPAGHDFQYDAPHMRAPLADPHPPALLGCPSCYATYLCRVSRLEGANWSPAPVHDCIAGGTTPAGNDFQGGTRHMWALALLIRIHWTRGGVQHAMPHT